MDLWMVIQNLTKVLSAVCHRRACWFAFVAAAAAVQIFVLALPRPLVFEHSFLFSCPHSLISLVCLVSMIEYGRVIVLVPPYLLQLNPEDNLQWFSVIRRVAFSESSSFVCSLHSLHCPSCQELRILKSIQEPCQADGNKFQQPPFRSWKKT